MSTYTAAAFNQRSQPRLFCIGRNYARHIAELGNSHPGRESLVFIKPPSALVNPGETIHLPDQEGEIHHEAELVVEIGKGGRHIAPEQARQHIRALGLGLDLTLRSLQTRLKHGGKPWERAKAFDYSAPLGPLTPLDSHQDLTDLEFSLHVDSHLRQHGHTSHMLIGITDLISTISDSWQLMTGDLIFTGTPEGVGPLLPGQSLRLSGPGLATARWHTA